MDQAQDQQGAPTGGGDKPPRSVPMAALAGAVVLVGLVVFALYRRNAAPQAAPETAAAPATSEAAPAPQASASTEGTMISAPLPIRLSPEASILSERYRCVCGCNDALSVCTCKNTPGSEVMKSSLQELVNQGKTPAEIDRGMSEKYGPACLLSNPAPPQTMPSHASGGKVPGHKP